MPKSHNILTVCVTHHDEFLWRHLLRHREVDHVSPLRSAPGRHGHHRGSGLHHRHRGSVSKGKIIVNSDEEGCDNDVEDIGNEAGDISYDVDDDDNNEDNDYEGDDEYDSSGLDDDIFYDDVWNDSELFIVMEPLMIKMIWW